MAEHILSATRGTVVDVFSADRPPVLSIEPGDTVTVTSLDASGFVAAPTFPGDQPATLIPASRGHCLTGPIEVRGAQPGSVLAVRLKAIDPGDWGWTVAGARDTPLNRRIGMAGAEPSWLLWTLHWDSRTRTGVGTDQYGHRVPLAPFLGVMGVPPAETGEHSTIPPRVVGGGNIDCRSLVAGTTLYLPVTVPGALLSLGDGHAAQGDGEVAGTALECPMTTTAVLDLVSEHPVATISAETPTERLTFGFDEDLNEATGQALSAMLDWMQVLYGVDRSTALALASPAVDLRITQVANGTWGVHAALAYDALS
jgi:acetamidase/formamidase